MCRPPLLKPDATPMRLQAVVVQPEVRNGVDAAVEQVLPLAVGRERDGHRPVVRREVDSDDESLKVAVVPCAPAMKDDYATFHVNAVAGLIEARLPGLPVDGVEVVGAERSVSASDPNQVRVEGH